MNALNYNFRFVLFVCNSVAVMLSLFYHFILSRGKHMIAMLFRNWLFISCLEIFPHELAYQFP